MSVIKTYKDLLIWQKGIEIVKEVYQICLEIPKDEEYGLKSQIKRAFISIPSNIAEGWGRGYTKNYIQYLKYARGSLLELETQIIIVQELDFISAASLNKIRELITEESKMINAFIKSIDK